MFVLSKFSAQWSDCCIIAIASFQKQKCHTRQHNAVCAKIVFLCAEAAQDAAQRNA